MDPKKSFTIVIAEDNQAMGILVERMLNRSGFITQRTLSGTETLEFCQNHSPETTFLLLDYNLGDMNAEEIVLKFKEAGQHFPFIVMTGYGSERVAVDMMKLGAEDYIIKNEQAIELLIQTLSQAIERKHTEKTLSKTQQALETAYRAITAAENGIVIARMDEDNYPIVYHNPAFVNISGCYYTDQCTLMDWLDSYRQQDQHGLLEFRNALETHTGVHVQLRREVDHHPQCHEVNISFVDNPEEHKILIGIVTDTTKNYLSEQEIHRLRENLESTQRLAIAGQIAKELAHEVGHPLTLISSKIQFMVARNSPEKESLSFILQHIDRITNLLRRFSSDSADTLVLAPVSIETIIQSVLHLCPIREDISVSIENDENLPDMHIDKAKITQVLLNLLINAVEACDQGGRIAFGASVKTNPDDQKQYLAVSVQDSGCGIAPEHRQKIFDPFFSTKSTSKNRGLGLPICQNIANQHQGWIDVQSKLNEGTRFTVMLPLEATGQQSVMSGSNTQNLYKNV
ncbi:MAG: two-component system sensor histidine kinase NtrB [Planctomycetota bacterium]|jgi:signal transduction histidine kinase/FixJ family two-component response regulator